MPADPTTTVTPASAEAEGQRRQGIVAGFAAYVLWGTFPLVFHELDGVPPFEILVHRIFWSFVLVIAVLALRGDRDWLTVLRTAGAERRRLVQAACLISINWLVYVYAVAEGEVMQAALGYYINPLFTVALGVFVVGERLRRLQLVALVFGAASVVVLTVAYGRFPWISLALSATFGLYGFLKRSVRVSALTSLAVETTVLFPIAAVSLAVVSVRGTGALGHSSPGRTVLLLSLGAVTAVPLLLFAASARRIPLTLLGLLQYLTPTAQLIWAVWLLDEDLPPERLAGFVLVWVALIVLTIDALRASRQPTGGQAAQLEAATELD